MQERTHSFGYWLRRRRKALDLTQDALAERVSCSGFSIRKIEADERRPSRQLALRLAASLGIPEEERRDFLDAARAVRATNRLRMDAMPAGTQARAGGTASAPDFPLDAAISAGVAAPFVGRSKEYGLIADCIERLAAGAGTTLLIEGEPGIGKSRLMREAASYAATQDVSVFATNCYEIERAMPYRPVIDLVTRIIDGPSASALRHLAPISLAELAALVPEIGERVPNLPQLSHDFPEARQARLPGALGHLLDAAGGGRPSILMVDDVHWADDASMRVLHYLARHAGQRAMLVIYAYRDEAVGTDERLARMLESLRREAAARRVPLTRLGTADTARLVAACADASQNMSNLGGVNLGAMDLAERLHRETDGNPFFLISILQSLNDGETQLEPRPNAATGLLPDALRAAVRVRLGHVPDAYRPVLETAAVLGRRFDFETLLDLTDEPEARLLDAVEALVKRRLLREEADDGAYDFTHDKVREVVYADIGGARRRLLHVSVAQALERRGEGETHARDAQLAEHYERAQTWPKALEYMVRAGEHSRALFALRDALSWLDRAVALSEQHPEALDERKRSALYEQRGAARAQAGQTQGAVADIRRVVDATRAAGDRAKTRDALVQLGMAYRRADAYEQATACLTEALSESRAISDEQHAADTLYHLGTVAWSMGRNDQAIAYHQQAVETCERMAFTGLVAVQAHHGRGETHFANAEPVAAIECYTRSLELARSIDDKSYESENLMMIGYACIGAKGLGDYPRAAANFEMALQIARAADLQWHIGPTLLGLDHVRACTGRYGEAWRGLQDTLRWMESLGQTRFQLIAYDIIGELLLDLGLNELALEQLQRGLALGRDTGIGFMRATIHAQAAVARTRLGQRDAGSPVESALEQTRRTSERFLMVRCIGVLAEIALATGDAQRCRAHADELLAIAELDKLRELEASARRWRGEAMLADAAYAEAEMELLRAAMIAKEIGRVRLEMDVEAALDRLFQAQGNRDAAHLHATRTHAIARAIEQSLIGSGLEVQPGVVDDPH